jgi:hypothetical protein
MRTAETIVENVRDANSKKIALGWTRSELTEDISILCSEILVELAKAERGNKAAAKRVRVYTKVLETLGKEYRKVTTK